MLRTCVRDHDPNEWARNGNKWRCLECARETDARYRERTAYQPDVVSVLMMVAGTHEGYVHIEERREAVRIMRSKGFSLARMGRHALCTPRQISRIVKSLEKTDR